MIGLRVLIDASCVQDLPFLITLLIFSVIFLMDRLEGLIRSFSLYFLKFQPKKSKPLLIWVISVLSSDSSKPLFFRKFLISSLISSAISLVLAVTIKSSANLTKFTLFFACLNLDNFPFLVRRYLSISIFSIPSNVMLASKGDTSNNRVGLLPTPSSRNRT